jgi:hypothetical protein
MSADQQKVVRVKNVLKTTGLTVDVLNKDDVSWSLRNGVAQQITFTKKPPVIGISRVHCFEA